MADDIILIRPEPIEAKQAPPTEEKTTTYIFDPSGGLKVEEEKVET